MSTRIEQYPTLLRGLQDCSAPERRTHFRHLCRTDLYFLFRYALQRKDAEHPWIFQRCREIEASPDGYLDLWSREHYKSAIITFALSIQDVLKTHGEGAVGREVCIGIFSHNRGIAKRFLRQIKYELESNGVLRENFDDILWDNPQKQSPKWSEDDGIVVKRASNPAEATVEAWGLVDGMPTGKHFPLLVYDDVVTEASVTTPDMISKVSDALSLSYALGAEGGARRFIGTRYHANDAYQTVIDRGSAKPRIHLLTQNGAADGEPVLRSKQWVADKRRDMGPYIFACQMLQNPLADETQGFRIEWVKYHDGFRREGMNVYILVDPAGAKNKRSDYTAVWVVGLGPDANIYVLDLIRDRLNLTQRAALIMRLHRKWKPMGSSGVRYEKIGMQADIEHIQEVQRQQNYRFDIIEVGGTTPKAERIKRLIPYHEQGRVFYPRTCYYTDYQGKSEDLMKVYLEQEFKPFPVSVHDDMLDALARLIEPEYPLIWPDADEYHDRLEPETFID